VLARHGLAPKRGYSQNFLVARPVVERIAEAVAAREGERVVELGPGLGTLTAALLRRGARVVAVERDLDMIEVLHAELGDHANLEIVHGDASTVRFDALAAPGERPAIAGNLPYAITGAILRNLTEQREAVSRAVLMVQKEVRDRLLASPGTKAWGALTVFTANAFEIDRVCDVRPGAFHPAPRVASAVVRLRPRETPRAVEDDTFRAVVRAIFDARRKTLRNALRAAFPPDERVDRALAAAAIPPMVRGETLDIERLEALAVQLAKRD
jgi:16S rRNA (adenine1518-N6/adenine1519-N6)-dimethyltransferase